jgi:hypothetical protein
LAREADPIAAIRRDLADLGIIGEGDSALLLYAVGTSRLLPKPLGSVVRGKSAAGKSILIDKTASLIPPEGKLEAMYKTWASWFNVPADYFVHKFYVSGERKHVSGDEAKDTTALLRQMLSEQHINRDVSVYNAESGEWVTVNVNRVGPIAYVESSTADAIFSEDLSRMLQVYADDSAEQTRRVVDTELDRCSRHHRPPDPEAIIDRHHEFQRYLAGLEFRVDIPFAPALKGAFPENKTDSRRAVRQLTATIQTLVLLRHYHRDKEDGYYVATLADYGLARQLLLPSFHALLGVGKDYPKALALWQALGGAKQFTTPAAKKAMGFTNDMATSRLLRALVDAGLVVKLSDQDGRTPALYEWVEDGPRLESFVLPTVAEVQMAWAALSN